MAIRAGFMITSYPFDSARSFFRWAEYLERQRIDSVWQSDRLVSTDPYLEAMSTMATLAGCTEKIKFGMNAIVAPLRDPLVLAKECATIDFLSNGRLLPMFGIGYPRAGEWAATGKDPGDRGARSSEFFELLRRLWSEERVTFEGRFYQYKDASILPRPVQKQLPLWIGGMAEAALKRTARLGTGWMAGIATPAEVGHAIRTIRYEAARLGRKIDDDHYGATLACRIGSMDDRVVADFPLVRRTGTGDDNADLSSFVAVGTAKDIVARIEAYKAAGAAKFVLVPIAMGDKDMFDQTERLCAEVVTAVEDRVRVPLDSAAA